MLHFELLPAANGIPIEHIVGDIRYFASENNPKPLREQFDNAYSFGGGWRPMKGFTMKDNCICYPGDPALKPLAKAEFRDQTIYIYPHVWVAIVEKDGSFEVSRMD